MRGFSWGIFSNKDTASGGEVLVENVILPRQTDTGATVRGSLVKMRNCKIIGTGGTPNGIAEALSVGANIVKVIDNTVTNMTRFYTGQQLEGMDIRCNTGMLITGNTVGDYQAGVASFVRNNQVSYFTVGFSIGGSKYEGNLTLGCPTPSSGGTAVGTNNSTARGRVAFGNSRLCSFPKWGFGNAPFRSNSIARPAAGRRSAHSPAPHREAKLPRKACVPKPSVWERGERRLRARSSVTLLAPKLLLGSALVFEALLRPRPAARAGCRRS